MMYLATKDMKLKGEMVKKGDRVSCEGVDGRRVQALIRTGFIMEIDEKPKKSGRKNKENKEIKVDDEKNEE